MDFIERIFGIAPDNGSGMTELSIFLALAAVLVLAYVMRKRNQRAPGDRWSSGGAAEERR